MNAKHDVEHSVEGGNAAPQDVEAERKARQRQRSIAIAVSLILLAVLFYVVTLVKMGDLLSDKAGS